MKPYLNSFRVRLFAAVVMLVLQVLFLGYLNLRTNRNTDRYVDQAYQVGQQRSNAYLMASLAHRLGAAENEADQQGIVTLMQQSIQNFDAIQTGLRKGSEALELEPIRREELLVILDDLDFRWANYKALLANYIEADAVARRELAPQIDTQSVIVFTFADRVALGIDEVVEQEIRSTVQVSIGLAVVTILATLLAIYVMLQATQATNRLSSIVSQFALGNYSIRTDKNSLIEFEQLGQGFNEMAQRIETQFTEITNARHEAERADQVKSAFLASMSHELRTPMNAVINFTKFVAMGDLGPVNDEQKETLYEVIDSARHLLNLINDVLDMSKIESGSLRLFVVDDVDVNAILDSVVSTSKRLIADKPVEVHTEIDPNLPHIRGDRQRILQILLNVLSNACKFTDKGFVKIRAAQSNGDIVVAVEDTGPGIAVEDKAAVFESFKQTSSGLRKGSGTGLGMPISKNLVEVHGGRLWFESEVNQGTTFFISIPVRAEHLTPTIAMTGEKA